MTSASALEECDFGSALRLANISQVMNGYEVATDEARMYYFTSGVNCGNQVVSATAAGDNIRCHCSEGQKLAVDVKDGSEGLQFHDHPTPPVTDPLTCPDLFLGAYIVNRSDYGAPGDSFCAEFCTPPAVVVADEKIAEGSCVDHGFIYSPATRTVQPGDSLAPFDVRVTALTEDASVGGEEISTCHCHSYEKISCPEEEAVNDTLYDEHILEIEDFCQGIIDGTESACPYKCFQPMEVLHLHYIECPTRPVDKTFKAVSASACHIAASAPADLATECKEVTNIWGGMDGDGGEEGKQDPQIEDKGDDASTGHKKTAYFVFFIMAVLSFEVLWTNA